MHKHLKNLALAVLIGSVTFSLFAEPLTFNLKRLQNGKSVAITEKDFADKYLLIAVGYTGCPDICPTTLLDMREAMKTLDNIPTEASKVQPLFITIDPLADTLNDITQYAAFFDPRIVGARADDYLQLDAIVEQLGASYGYTFEGKPVLPPELPKGYTVMHSIHIYLYSPKRELLDVFPYNMNGKQLAKNIITYTKQ